MTKGKSKSRTINELQPTHHGIRLFRVKFSGQQIGTKHGHERYSNEGRANHREGFGKCQRMKELAFLTGQGKNWNEREHNDRHGKEDRSPH